LRTTPFHQYFLGFGIFKKVSNCVEKFLKVRTTHFDQYFLGICKIDQYVELDQGSCRRTGLEDCQMRR
jgi:hypothetical protein